MKKTNPTIELYMYGLQQEFELGKDVSAFMDKKSVQKGSDSFTETEEKSVETAIHKDYSMPWAQWVNKHTKWHSKSMKTQNLKMQNSLLNFLYREEDFGGIVFDPDTDKVYKVNSEGLELIKEMMNHLKNNEDLASFQTNNFKAVSVEKFISFLKGAGYES